MTCHDARELFSLRLDDVLDAAERTALDAHLAGCAECRREWERFRTTVALLRAVEPQRAPVGFVDRVLAVARAGPWHRRLVRALFLPWPVKLPIEAAAIVLVGVIVATIFRGSPELQQAARVEPSSREDTTAPASAPREPREQRAMNLRDDATDAARRRDLEKTEAPPAARAKREAEAPAGATAPAPAEEPAQERVSRDVAASRLSAPRPATPADISGRLVVKNREVAARALAELVARARGREVARHGVADGTVIELTIPRAAWAGFVRELARLGAWSPEREPAELPAEIRVALQLVE